MAYANHVSKSQIIELLGKLADDDGYRIRFQRDPDAALGELDFPPGSFAGFPGNSEQHGMLADKTIFAAARQRMVDEVAGECLCMIIPNFRLDYGDQHRRSGAAMQ
ncbi:MAG TPA: NHLP-related RiPP peptide [Rudaea sp.]|jgi:putative modified peptide|nr:NHLP-related RiPP peptide [Rudaea sp.]